MTCPTTARVDGIRVRALLEAYGWTPAQVSEGRFQLPLMESSPRVPDLALSATVSGLALRVVHLAPGQPER